MSKIVQLETEETHPLIGTWVNGDEYESGVEYAISRITGIWKAGAVDLYDGEEGEVHDISYNDESSTLSFSVYWNSTGRFAKIQLHVISQNRVSFTYTFTDNEMWFRKGTEPA